MSLAASRGPDVLGLWLHHPNLCIPGHMVIPTAQAEEPTCPQRAPAPPAVPDIKNRGHTAVIVVKSDRAVWQSPDLTSRVKKRPLAPGTLCWTTLPEQHAVSQHSRDCPLWAGPYFEGSWFSP